MEEMTENPMSFKGQSFQLFNKTFPEVSSVRYSVNILFYEENDFRTYQLDVIGPFLFASTINFNGFYVFIPDYVIRNVPNSNDIELIPMNPFLQKVKRFRNLKKSEKIDLLQILRNSLKSVEKIPKQIPDLQFDAQLYDTKNMTAEQITIVVNSKEFEIQFEHCKKPSVHIQYSVSLHIYSGCDYDQLQPGHVMMCLIAQQISENGYIIFLSNFDHLILAYLALSVKMIQIKFAISQTSPQKNKSVKYFAADFPDIFPQFDSIPEILKCDLIVKPIEKLCKIKQSNDVLFKTNNIKPPLKATKELNIISFENEVKRTILIPSNKTANKISFQNKNKFVDQQNNIEQNSFDRELKLMKDQISVKSFSFDLKFEYHPIFLFANKNDSEYFSKSGASLLELATNPSRTFTSDSIKPNIYMKFSFQGNSPSNSQQEVIEKVQKIVNKFPLCIDCNSSDFTNFVVTIASIVASGINCVNFPFRISQICLKNEVFIDKQHILEECIPNNKENSDTALFLLTFVYRAAVLKCLHKFFSIILKSQKECEELYQKYAPMISPSFVIQLELICETLTYHDFEGAFEPAKHNLILPIVSEMIELSVYTNAKKIAQNSRSGSPLSDVFPDIIQLLVDLTKFVKSGYLKNDIWDLFVSISNSTGKKEVDHSLFNYYIAEISKTEKFSHLKIPSLFLHGLQNGAASSFILIIAKNAIEKKTHQKDSLIVLKEPVMMVTQSLKMLESIMIEVPNDFLDKYSPLF